MFFNASRLAWWLLTPHNLLAVALAVAALLLLTRWRRAGVWLTVATALGCLVVAATPLPAWSLRLLEDRFPQVDPLPERIGGIIVLGGAISPALSAARGQVALNAQAERMSEGAGLAHRFPDARLIFTGGDASLRRTGLTEAAFAPTVFAQMGIAPNRLEIEAASRNTYENAVRVAALIGAPADAADGPWLLVTSAFHMPRSVGCFRRVGLDVLAYPVDYRTDGRLSWSVVDVNLERGLGLLLLSVHEWVGILAYWLNDYLDDPFPAAVPATANRDPAGAPIDAVQLTRARESRTGEG